MEDKDDGVYVVLGPTNEKNYAWQYASTGISVRDYLAAKAMQSYARITR